MPSSTLALTVLEGKAGGEATRVISSGFRKEMGSVDRKKRDGVAVRMFEQQKVQLKWV